MNMSMCVCVCEGGSGRRVRIYTGTFQGFSWRWSCVFTPVTLKSNPIGFKDRGQCHPRAATVSLRQLPWSNIFSWHWFTPLKGQRNKRAKKTPRTSPEITWAMFICEGNKICFLLELTGNKTSPIPITYSDNVGKYLCFLYFSRGHICFLFCCSTFIRLIQHNTGWGNALLVLINSEIKWFWWAIY